MISCRSYNIDRCLELQEMIEVQCIANSSTWVTSGWGSLLLNVEYRNNMTTDPVVPETPLLE